MMFLILKLELFMLFGGVECMIDFIRKYICRRLEFELESFIDIFLDDKGKLLVVFESVLLKYVVLEI